MGSKPCSSQDSPKHSETKPGSSPKGNQARFCSGTTFHAPWEGTGSSSSCKPGPVWVSPGHRPAQCGSVILTFRRCWGLDSAEWFCSVDTTCTPSVGKTLNATGALSPKRESELFLVTAWAEK